MANPLLLRRLGPRILDAMGPDDLLVRLGGDESAIVIASVTSVAGIMKRVEQLLEILRRRVSSLKIDRSFVGNMESGENEALIVNTVTGLAHNLGMTVWGKAWRMGKPC